MGGLVYFGEFEDLTPKQIWLFFLGTLITFAGLYQLTKKENHTLNNAGPQGHGFDVLPSRRVSEDSFMDHEFDSFAYDDGVELGRPTSARELEGSKANLREAAAARDAANRDGGMHAPLSRTGSFASADGEEARGGRRRLSGQNIAVA